MPTNPADEDETAADGSPDYRQLSIVAIAAVAIILAAFLAPAGGGLSTPDADPSPDREPREADPEYDGDRDEPPDGPNGLPEIDIHWPSLLEWFEFDWIEPDEGDTEPEYEPEPEFEPGDGPPAPSACTVVLDDDPTPGSEVTATIHHDREPVAEIPVWYNDEFVGETNDRGQVTGEVPYVEELVVRLETDDHPECEGGEDATIGSLTAVGAGAGGAAMNAVLDDINGPTATSVAPAIGAAVSDSSGELQRASSGATGTLFASSSSSTDGALLASTSSPTGNALERIQQADEAENGTVEYEVDGDVELFLDGTPQPGDTVTVEASIEGVPMAEASVTIDGEEVAETDADGTAAIEIPDDGTESFELGVARGDFEGTTTVEIHLLEASLSPDGLAPIPGSPGVLEATVGGEPVEDAEVRIGDEVVGTTDEDGELALSFPVDPTTSITVSAGDQTASVSLASAYGPIALVLGLAVVGLAAVANRTHGRQGSAAVLGVTGTVLVALTVEAFYGRAAGTLTLLAVGAIAAAVLYSRSDRTVVDERPDPGDAVSRLLERIVARLLELVAHLERALEYVRARLGAVRAWAASLPRSATALGAAVVGWVGTLPARAITRVNGAIARIRQLPRAAVGAVLATGLAIAGGYVVDGARGAAIVAVALAIAGVLYWRRDRERETDESGDGDESDGIDDDRRLDPNGDTSGTTSSDDRPTFRELWRRFARRIAPRRWHTHTPGEIQRAALEQGYPREPVADLTTLFREVEYGRRHLSADVRDRADDAYTDLTEPRDEAADEASEPDGNRKENADSGPNTDTPTTDSGADSDTPEADSSSDSDAPTGSETGGERP